MEKPIAHTLEEAQKIVDLSHNNNKNKVIMISENYPYKLIFKKAKEIIQSGKIGKVLSFSLNVIRAFDSNNPYVQTSWRQIPKHPGGYLSDGGVHQISAIVDVLDNKIESVMAFAVQIKKMNGAEDTLASVIKTEGGIIGTCHITFAAGAPPASNLYIVGEDAAIQILDLQMLHILKKGKDGNKDVKEEMDFEQLGTGKKEKLDVQDEFRDWANVIRSNRKLIPIVTPDDAYHHLEVIVAMLQSAKEGRQVNIDLKKYKK